MRPVDCQEYLKVEHQADGACQDPDAGASGPKGPVDGQRCARVGIKVERDIDTCD